jgi:pimeloyl-ACP methyl ester carboxylesterase
MPIVEILGVPHTYDLTAPTRSPEVLVFVHGWLLSRSYWQPLVGLLAPQLQCLTYDLRGFGDSAIDGLQLPCPGYSLAAYSRDLLLLLKELGIAKAWLVGHSLGGSIALWAADQSPQQVAGVICLNAGGGIYLKEEFERLRALGQQLVKFRPRWLRYVPLLDRVFARASVSTAIAPHWGRQRLIDFVIAHPDAALGALLESTTEAEVHRLPQLVSRLRQPVYFITGAQDPIMEPQYVRHLASFHSLFQDDAANVTEIANCGHLSMLEHPEAVAAQIRLILAQHCPV